jgi:hypothetical protein
VQRRAVAGAVAGALGQTVTSTFARLSSLALGLALAVAPAPGAANSEAGPFDFATLARCAPIAHVPFCFGGPSKTSAGASPAVAWLPQGVCCGVLGPGGLPDVDVVPVAYDVFAGHPELLRAIATGRGVHAAIESLPLAPALFVAPWRPSAPHTLVEYFAYKSVSAFFDRVGRIVYDTRTDRSTVLAYTADGSHRYAVASNGAVRIVSTSRVRAAANCSGGIRDAVWRIVRTICYGGAPAAVGAFPKNAWIPGGGFDARSLLGPTYALGVVPYFEMSDVDGSGARVVTDGIETALRTGSTPEDAQLVGALVGAWPAPFGIHLTRWVAVGPARAVEYFVAKSANGAGGMTGKATFDRRTGRTAVAYFDDDNSYDPQAIGAPRTGTHTFTVSAAGAATAAAGAPGVSPCFATAVGAQYPVFAPGTNDLDRSVPLQSSASRSDFAMFAGARYRLALLELLWARRNLSGTAASPDIDRAIDAVAPIVGDTVASMVRDAKTCVNGAVAARHVAGAFQLGEAYLLLGIREENAALESAREPAFSALATAYASARRLSAKP